MRRFLLLALLTLPAFGQTSDTFLNSLFAVRTFHEVTISPDGKRVAWAEKDHGIWTANADGSNSKQLTSADDEGLAWSPDGRLAHLARKDGQKQVVVAGVRLTSAKGFLAEPKWSPDGKSIAFLLIENAGRDAGPLVAMSRAIGVMEEHIAEQRVAVVDVASRKLRLVTPADMYVYHYHWAPDSRHMVAEAAPGSGDSNYWTAQLHVVDTGAATMKAIYKPALQLANPRWSPDGAHIAFIEGLMSDEGVTGGDVFLMDANGAGARNITPDIKTSITSFEWLDAGHIAIAQNAGGEAAIGRLSIADGSVAPMWQGPEGITADYGIGASIANDGKTSAIIRSSFNHPPEVWAGPFGAWKQITHQNDAMHATWGDATNLHWRNGTFDVSGWLLAPARIESGHTYPMIVWIHGGPASASLNRWPPEQAALLSSKGYYVFFPNFRGSYGQGEAFTRANVKDFGHGDLSDILTGVDEVLRTRPVDSKRLGIWGWSYGGYMTMWTVTQTDRFNAAVAGAGLSNWLSYYGENDIDEWMIPYFGASVYDDPAVYARSAPITFVKNVHTPTLMLVGERDGECPAPQSFEFWHALKTLGVETQLVVYPDEGHNFVKPEHKRDVARRLVQWFDDHLR